MSLGCLRAHLAVVIALVLVVLLAGCSLGSAAPERDDQVIAARQSAGIADCPQAPSTPPKPRGLPDVSLPCLGGDVQVSLAGLAGSKPLVINVWATWCGPCRAEAPILAAVSADLADQVQFLGIDHVDPPASAAVSFAQAAGWRYPQLADPNGDGGQALGVAGLPYTFFVGLDGTVAYRHSGAFESEAQLRDLVSRYLGVT